MKIIAQLAIYLVCLCSLKAQCPVPEIISPNGGESLIAGSLIEIVFDYGPEVDWNAPQVFFYYSIDEGANWILEATIPVDTNSIFGDPVIHYQWQVPEVTSQKCLIKIQKYDWGCWDESDWTFSIVPLISFVEEDNIEKKSIGLFPNPVRSGQKINIEINGFKGYSELRLMNLDGHFIQTFNILKPLLSISTENLPKGLYFLQVNSHEGAKSVRLIIN